MMDNQENRHWTDDPELLAKYVLGHIEDAERRLLDEHLAGCEICRMAVRKEKELAAGIRLAGRQHLKERLRGRIMVAEPNFLRRYQLAGLAAAVIVAFVGIGFFRLYFGSFEWPSKFSTRKFVLKQNFSDSSKLKEENAPVEKPASEIAEAKKSEPEVKADREEPAALSNDLATRDAAGAGVNSESQLREFSETAKASQPEEHAGAVWLLGTITMIPDAHPARRLTHSLSQARTEQDAKEKSALKQGGERTRTFTIRKGSVSQLITLSELPPHKLPQTQLFKYDAQRSVQTLVEHTPDGLNITMYRDLPAHGSEIYNATIVPVTEDSLIVTMGNERIAYRIPGGWGSATKVDNDRR